MGHLGKAFHSSLQSSCKCGTPQLIQQLAHFKDLLSYYLPPTNKPLLPELLSGLLAELGLTHFSLVRNLQVTQRLSSLKSLFHWGNMENIHFLRCFPRTWQSVPGTFPQVLSRLLSGDHFILMFSPPPPSFQKKINLSLWNNCQQAFCSSTAEPPQKLPRTPEIALGSIFKSFLCQQSSFHQGSQGFGDHSESKPYKGSRVMRNLLVQ